MMRRALVLLAVSLALLLSASPAAASSPTVTVSPAAGYLSDAFTFTGSGFLPGEAVSVLFISPDGARFGRFVDGVEAPLAADSAGAWVIVVVPSRDFAGEAGGEWTAQFCTATYCWTGTFTVSL
jgi:hypothetical protein